MKQPLRRGTSIDMQRVRVWVNAFAGYRHPIDATVINQWLDQFDNSHKDIIARLLDSIEFISVLNEVSIY